MDGLSNLYIPVCGLFIALLSNICFFSKKRIKNKETSIFARILIYSLVDSIMMVSIFSLAIWSNNSIPLLKFLNKIDYAMYILWASNFFLYVYYIVTKNSENGGAKYYNFFFYVTTIIDIILMFLILISDVNIHINGNAMYSDGLALTFTLIGCVIYFLSIFICLIVNIKNVFTRKLTPLYVFILLIGLVMILNRIDQTIVIISAVLAYINLIMFFTIENPDVRLLEKMKFAKDQAERANHAKSDFLSSMSHEIRTPLNAIVGLSEDNLTYKDSIPKEVFENSIDIVNASQTLLEIVGNILDINKIEANKMELIENPYKFKEEITSMCKITQTRIGEKNIMFYLNIADDIPYELIGDKGKVKEIINNLLTNAIKYTEEGTINLSIKCINNINERTTNIMITCQDTGRGIKKENIEKLFTKFERLDVEKNSTTEGTGLGLAITKALVEMMGGNINVQSQFGQGSIFVVNIPQKISKFAKPVVQNNVITSSTSYSHNTLTVSLSNDIVDSNVLRYGNKKILIVDDNKLNIKVAKKAMQDFKFEIDECYDGIECLNKIVNGNEYDLILMDIMMPNMSGETALEKLKENPNFKIPTIALTADAIAGAKEKYIKEGFVDYIAKPFSRDQIREKLDLVFKNNEVPLSTNQTTNNIENTPVYIAKEETLIIKKEENITSNPNTL